jgi:tRNA (guanine-N7-)-methyltransferase
VPPRRENLYGRRKGKPLSLRRAALMAEAFPKLAIATDVPPPPRLAALFAGVHERVRLEIGFGGGEHLIAAAAAELETGFIGIEPFLNGMAKAVATIVDCGLGNVRLYMGEASTLLDWLPQATLDAVDILYPDPWPKQRHWKRRFISKANLDRLARVLRPGGTLRLATDVASYVTWTLALIINRADLVWTAETKTDWTVPFPGWSGTRYEAKAIAAGRTPTYLTFRRV